MTADPTAHAKLIERLLLSAAHLETVRNPNPPHKVDRRAVPDNELLGIASELREAADSLAAEPGLVPHGDMPQWFHEVIVEGETTPEDIWKRLASCRATPAPLAEAIALIAQLSDDLQDEGSCWSTEGLHSLRTRVANILPDGVRPEWLDTYRRAQPQSGEEISLPEDWTLLYSDGRSVQTTDSPAIRDHLCGDGKGWRVIEHRPARSLRIVSDGGG